MPKTKLSRQEVKDLQRMFWLSNKDIEYIYDYIEKEWLDKDAGLVEILWLEKWWNFYHRNKHKSVDPAQA